MRSLWSARGRSATGGDKKRRTWEVNRNRGLEERGWEGVDWIDPAHGMDRWRTVMNTVTNFGVP